ncbi:hypothetical protein LH452_01230 [Laribacter hongkongensis]|uniref:hypothetical protein n=1 Tax=Laribacter hongkongensis TaxID=168471 RepID=UPI001EFE0D1A|nr:hypothetical protein [Laribacter hongkongensis]MCG9057577.1 hypothetical protein [Laribacter hongkongensis]MCG9085969.1 hypothetical protein [Laribacter hongkongensis]
MEARIQSLEAQVNAMAQAWLYLAANVEVQCGIDMEEMESALRDKEWPDNPEIDHEARATIQWLCLELDYARLMRRVMLRDGRVMGH